jgi:hypothetical protein
MVAIRAFDSRLLEMLAKLTKLWPRNNRSHMSAAYDFFISYTKVDEEWARWIAWQIKQEGYKCLFQARDFVPSQSFIARMKQALDSSNQMIAVLSDEYFQSRYCQDELEAAFAASMLVPVRVRKCTIPRLYRSRICIDLFDSPPSAAQEKLIDGVRASLIGHHEDIDDPIDRPPVYPGDKRDHEPPLEIVPKKEQVRSTTRLLLLGCAGETGLDIKGEFERIEVAIKSGKYGKSIRINTQLEVTAETLFERLNSIRPHIFHFSGKQDAGRILMKDRDGATVAIPESALSGMFRALDKGIDLVVLDTCHSLPSAREVAKTVDAAIGVNSWIYDDEATSYYEGFYRALASGGSLFDACGQAEAFAICEGAAKSRLPTLCCKRRVDPSKMFFTKHSRARISGRFR